MLAALERFSLKTYIFNQIYKQSPDVDIQMLEYSYNSVGRKSLNTRITIELSNCGVNDSKYRPNSETKHVHLHAFKPELRSLRVRNINVSPLLLWNSSKDSRMYQVSKQKRGNVRAKISLRIVRLFSRMLHEISSRRINYLRFANRKKDAIGLGLILLVTILIEEMLAHSCHTRLGK